MRKDEGNIPGVSELSKSIAEYPAHGSGRDGSFIRIGSLVVVGGCMNEEAVLEMALADDELGRKIQAQLEDPEYVFESPLYSRSDGQRTIAQDAGNFTLFTTDNYVNEVGQTDLIPISLIDSGDTGARLHGLTPADPLSRGYTIAIFKKTLGAEYDVF